jgi:dephospho-CoA kinase
MLKIGVTGGIGSGKSVVCEIFKILGVPVYNADEQAKNLIDSDPYIINKLVEKYGQEIYIGGALDRKKLSQIVFNNKDELQFLNETVHPHVFAHFDEWLELNINKNNSYIVKEAALLFESGSYKELDKIILVSAPEKIRISRVVERDRIKEVEVKKIIQNQMSEDDKIAKAEFIINNDGDTLIIPQVLKLHEQFLKGKK